MIRALLVAVLCVGCSGGRTGAGGGAGGSAGGGSGGGSGGAGGGGTAISADAAATNFATAYCNKLNSCVPFSIGAYYGAVADCIARTKLILLPPLALANTGSSPTKLNGCVPMMTSASCAALRAGTAGCKFTGPLAAGTACGAGSQCQSGYCRLTTQTCGVCATRVTNGGNCTVSEDCLDGSKCVNALCVAKRGLGAACSQTLPCGDLLYCKAGQCTAVATTAGAACDPNDSDSCDYLSGVFCNSNNVCAQIQFAGPGATCGNLTAGYVECSGGASCHTTGGLSGTCIAAALDNQACNPANDLYCLEAATCEAGVCKVYDPASCL